MHFTDHIERERAKQLFNTFIDNLPSGPMTSRVSLHFTLENGWVMDLCLASCYDEVDAVHSSDRELLMWIVRGALKAGTLHVSWSMLLSSLEAEATAESIAALYESAKRIASSLAVYSIAHKTLDMGSNGGSFPIADHRMLVTPPPKSRRRSRMEVASSSQSTGPTQRQISLTLNPKFLEMAACALAEPTFATDAIPEVLRFPSANNDKKR